MESLKFKTISYNNPKKRGIYTVPTWTDKGNYVDPKYAPLIFNERNKQGSGEESSYGYHNKVNYTRRNYNKQTDSINFAVIEQNIDDGIFDTAIDHDFIEKVKSCRENKKSKEGQPMTQKDLANACSLPLATIRDFEAGKCNLSHIDVVKIKKALDI